MAVGGRRPWYQTALPDTLPLLSLAPPHLLRLFAKEEMLIGLCLSPERLWFPG